MNPDDEKPRGGAFVVALVFYAVVMCFAVFRANPPAAKPADAPVNEFSGVRAKSVLKQLVGNGVPHPVGSVADAAVRDAIVRRLTELGYQPRVQEDFVCDSTGTCADVKNILARLDGQEPGSAVMVASHYDSVPAGPGASDDGAGTVSVLEIARALKASAPLRHPVVFLIDEGEEAGLFGAVAFVEDDPWRKDVNAVVNIDNRGTTGSSTMFETGNANEWLMRLYAKSVHHPNTDSLSYTVYKSLPNDTDFTMFKAAGYQGFNFAFLEEVAHYHTPLDNVANTSVGSIQSEGGSALEALRALANSDLNPGPPSDAVYADVLGWKTIWWPARWTAGFAAAALVLLILEISVLVRREEMRLKGFAVGFVSWPLILVVAAILGEILQFFLRVAGAAPSNWVAHPTPLLFAAWALGFGAVAAVAGLLGSRAGFWGMWAGVWIWWGIGALALGVTAPGLSFTFVVPALAAGIFGLAIPFLRREGSAAGGIVTVIPAVVTAVIGVYAVWFLYAALGGTFLAGITACVALVAAPLAPLAVAVSSARRWRFPAATFTVAVIGTAAALVVSPFSTASPERLNIQYHQDGDTGKAQWLAYAASGRLPLGLRSVASFVRLPDGIYPWDAGKPLASDAPSLNLPAPTLTIEQASVSYGKTNYDVQLKSARGAPEILMAFAPDVEPDSVSIAGRTIPAISGRILSYTNGWRIYGCVDAPPEGFQMKFTLAGTKSVTALLLDETYGLPSPGMFLSAARPATATASQDGDTAVVMRHITLQPQ